MTSMPSPSMLCPACRAQLVPGSQQSFETLDDHVCDPNGIRYPRPTWVCRNPTCRACQQNVFWSDDGDGPYRDSQDKIFWLDNNPHPFYSPCRQIYFACSYHDEDRRLKIGALTIRREVKYESNDHGDKVGKTVHYSFWWKGTLWISGWRMLCFTLRGLYRKRRYAEEEFQRELDLIRSWATWRRVEWWRKAAMLWVKAFHTPRSIAGQAAQRAPK